MILLGVDPGTLISGWGVISTQDGKEEIIDFGAIRPKATLKLSDRYHIIFKAIQALIVQFSPDAIAIETQFTGKNVASTLKLAMARAVVLIAAREAGIPIFEYAPMTIKKAVTGTGSASKEQVKGMIRRIFALQKDPEPEDAADALACALCHAHAARFNQFAHQEI